MVPVSVEGPPASGSMVVPASVLALVFEPASVGVPASAAVPLSVGSVEAPQPTAKISEKRTRAAHSFIEEDSW
jgi:hypothetical protein